MQRIRNKRARIRETAQLGSSNMSSGTDTRFNVSDPFAKTPTMAYCPPPAPGMPYPELGATVPGFYEEDAVDMELQEDFERFLDEEEEKQIEAERLFVLAQEAKKKEAAAKERKMIEDQAIGAYLKKQDEERMLLKMQMLETHAQLEARGDMTKQQIDIMLKIMYPTASMETTPLAIENGPSNSLVPFNSPQTSPPARIPSTPSISSSSSKRSKFNIG